MPSTNVFFVWACLAVALPAGAAEFADTDYATRDPLCERMAAPTTDVVGLLQDQQTQASHDGDQAARTGKADDVGGSSTPYFLEPIPPIVHHVWFGSSLHFEEERAQGWQRMARQYGYAYHLWTEDDDAFFRDIMGDALFAYMAQLRQTGHFDAASDICRYVLLEHMGGIYTDVDVAAPQVDGKLVDMRHIVDFVGLIMATERQVREVGNAAFYAPNHIIMSTPHHPVLKQMVDSLVPNRDAFARAGGDWRRGAQFWTGQIMWAMTLNGPFTVLPLTYLRQYNIFWERRVDYPYYLHASYQARCARPEGCQLRSIHTAPLR